MTIPADKNDSTKGEELPKAGSFLSLESKLVIGWIITVGGWFILRRNQLRIEQSKNSYNHKHVLNNSKFSAEIEIIKDYLNDPELLKSHRLNSSEKRAIGKISTEMESMALDIEQGYITERYVYKTLKTFVQRFLLVSYREINEYRVRGNSSTFDKNFEIMVLRQHFYKKPFIQSIYEFLTSRSGFELSGNIISAHLRTRGQNIILFIREIFRFEALPPKISYLDDEKDFVLNIKEYENRMIYINRIEYTIFGIILFVIVFIMFG